MDEIGSLIGWKWNNVFEEMERNFRTFSAKIEAVAKGWLGDISIIAGSQKAAERSTQARQKSQNTWTTVCANLDLDIYNATLTSF